MPQTIDPQFTRRSFTHRTKQYRDVRDFMQRNSPNGAPITNFLIVRTFSQHCEHFPVYDKSMLAVYTVPSQRPNHTWLSIYHDMLGMIAQVELSRTLPNFLATFTKHNISINPEPSEF